MAELPIASDFAEIRRRFVWRIPARFNIATDVLDRHADGSRREALVELRGDGRLVWDFDSLARLSRKLANVLEALGVGRGDRVGVLLGQQVETLLTHTAAWRIGAITVPLFRLFGPDALAYRLGDSAVKLLVTDAEGAARVESVRGELPELRHLLLAESDDPERGFWPLLERASDRHVAADTSCEDPAIVIYTSGTTGPPKGALHAHRVLLGHLPGVQMPHELFPQPGDRFWTPADWAWIGGLFDVLMPSLHFGVPVVAWRAARFDPEAAVAVMAREGVRNVFMPPTAIRMMRQAAVKPLEAGVRLRTIGSGGESLGADVLEWGRAAFGVTINEFYGQTEANLLVSNMASTIPVRPGSMGVAVPGHEVAVVDGEGRPLPPGETGTIAVKRSDPVMFLEYLNRPDATAEKFRGEWMVTGDLGRMDEDGYFWYLGREDDVINSAGYRIGPGEIESCLLQHPAVGLCAVIGVPDPLRGEVPKAFVVPKPGFEPSERLAAEIRDFVKARLAAHAYPRVVEFVESLPLTATGKIRRSELRERERRRQARD
ncbi:Acetyl-coenzyme A synthetase [bacterium HR39]|nr:Acetyl-coenzyme A synthetase [bacterium HR39]